MRKGVTKETLGRSSQESLKTRGTTRATLAVLIRAAKGELASGLVYDGFHNSLAVVRVRDDRLAIKARQTMDGSTWGKAIAALKLRRAYDDQDELAARKAIEKLHGINPKHLSSKIHYHEDGGILAGAEFTKSMTQARFVLWLNLERIAEQERLEPGLLCPNLETALYVRGALRELRVCPCCDTPFLPDRPDQIYCSIRCRETHRKRRQRTKNKIKRRSEREGVR